MSLMYTRHRMHTEVTLHYHIIAGIAALLFNDMIGIVPITVVFIQRGCVCWIALVFWLVNASFA